MYIVRYSEIQAVLSAAVEQLRGGESDRALETLEGFIKEKPVGDLAICGIIGRVDVKGMVPASFMVNSCSMSRLEEFAERMDNTALEVEDLADEVFDRIDCPSDFMKEYPSQELVRMDSELENLVHEWTDNLDTDSKGRITEDFLYWKKGTPLWEVIIGI